MMGCGDRSVGPAPVPVRPLRASRRSRDSTDQTQDGAHVLHGIGRAARREAGDGRTSEGRRRPNRLDRGFDLGLPGAAITTSPVSAPLASRTRRQLSYSWMISIGRPGLRYIHSTSYWVPGPTRMLTRPDFRLTKRGSGRPLGPSVTGWLWSAFAEGVARPAARLTATRTGASRRRIRAAERT